MIPTILDAAEQIRDGRLSPTDLLEACLKRIDRLDSQVQAWVLVDRDRARAEAVERTDEVRCGQWRGPLHGIPLGIKDIVDVFDWPTACGSWLWRQSIARHDAPVVTRLRDAGAVLVGKTVTTQYASFDPPPTRNPWNLARTPGGSSSGSAAAVACGMCLGAIGSQTGGSITRPASYCGVVACKPTYGRASTMGVLPLAASMDHVGPMARTVRDVALLMQTLSDAPAPSWTAALAQPLPTPRLGRLRGFFEARADDDVRASMERVCNSLEEKGARIRDVALPAAFDAVIARHRTVMAVEAAAYHRERLHRHPDDYDPNIRQLLHEGLSCPAPEYALCKVYQRALTAEMNALLEGFDALLCPATTTPAPDSATTGDPAFNSPWSYTGLPVVSFPIAFSPAGLPLSLQLVGARAGEDSVFPAAAWCEAALSFHPGDPPLVGD